MELLALAWLVQRKRYFSQGNIRVPPGFFHYRWKFALKKSVEQGQDMSKLTSTFATLPPKTVLFPLLGVHT